MNFSEKDHGYMEIAIKEAKISFAEGNFPVGAALVVDGELVDKDRNSIRTNSDWISHAKMKLLSKHSSLIKKHRKETNSVLENGG